MLYFHGQEAEAKARAEEKAKKNAEKQEQALGTARSVEHGQAGSGKVAEEKLEELFQRHLHGLV